MPRTVAAGRAPSCCTPPHTPCNWVGMSQFLFVILKAQALLCKTGLSGPKYVLLHGSFTDLENMLPKVHTDIDDTSFILGAAGPATLRKGPPCAVIVGNQLCSRQGATFCIFAQRIYWVFAPLYISIGAARTLSRQPASSLGRRWFRYSWPA